MKYITFMAVDVHPESLQSNETWIQMFLALAGHKLLLFKARASSAKE